jgi:PPE-repeat protein
MAGVWISPKLSDGLPGLNPEDATGWKQVWNVSLYEPDRLMSATYGLGGVASYGGYLYWGTMHVPTKATKVFQKVYPQTDPDAIKAQVKNTQRAIAIFRGKDLGTPDQKIELLYGAPQLPAYDAASNTWSAKSTNYTPLYGKSGFGQPFNNYTWRMAVTDGKLFVGTMDWSYLVHDLDPERAPDPAGYGGDLWMFSSTDTAATAVNTTGLGNYLNYGIRNMIADGDGLFLGMANPMNLRTDPTDDIPEGGWELISMKKICP